MASMVVNIVVAFRPVTLAGMSSLMASDVVRAGVVIVVALAARPVTSMSSSVVLDAGEVEVEAEVEMHGCCLNDEAPWIDD